MAGHSPTLTKNFKAEAAVKRRRIVKFGADAGSVLASTGAAAASFGISSEIDSALGERCDVHLAGLAEVDFGGAVSPGDLVTSDAEGRAVTAAPAAAANANVIGQAMTGGVLNDVGVVNIVPGRVQG